MARPEYPTSIRLTLVDKRRLRKQAEKSKRSLAGLIQMILIQWLETQEKRETYPVTVEAVEEMARVMENRRESGAME